MQRYTGGPLDQINRLRGIKTEIGQYAAAAAGKVLKTLTEIVPDRSEMRVK